MAGAFVSNTETSLRVVPMTTNARRINFNFPERSLIWE